MINLEVFSYMTVATVSNNCAVSILITVL